MGFLAQYLGCSDRRILLVAGAGFDPRTCAVAVRLSNTSAVTHALLIKEERPNPPQELVDRANANEGPRFSPCWQSGKWSPSTYSGQTVRSSADATWSTSSDGRGWTKRLTSSSTSAPCRWEQAFRSSATLSSVFFTVRNRRIMHLVVAHDPHLDAGIRGKGQRYSRLCPWIQGRFYTLRFHGCGAAVAAATDYRTASGTHEALRLRRPSRHVSDPSISGAQPSSR